MASYYAVTRRQGQWVYLCSGSDPEAVYANARLMIESHERGVDDEGGIFSPVTEQQLDALRVVPEETAHEMQLSYPQTLVDEG